MFPSASHFQTHVTRSSPRLRSRRTGLTAVSLLALLLSILPTTRADAQWVIDGRPTCTAPGSQYGPAMVGDGVGGVIIFWVDNRSGNYNQIFAQRISNSGVLQWPGTGVVICTVSGSQYPMVAIGDGVGGAIVAWTDDRSGPTSFDIYAQRISALGVAQWTTDGVEICTAGNLQYWPSAATDGLGGAIIAWNDERTAGGSDDVYVQRINAAGDPQWLANGLPACTSAHNSSDVQVLPDGVGGAFIAWSDLRNGQEGDIYAQRVTNTGQFLWLADGVVVCDYGTLQSSPKMTHDGSGGVIIVWEDWYWPMFEESDVYAQRIDSEGTLQWPARGVALSDTYFDNQVDTEIVSDGAGGAIVSWQDWGGEDPLNVRAQRIDGDGTVLWTPNGVFVADGPDNEMSPVIVADGVGGAIITWQKGYLNDTDVFAQHINEFGEALWVDDGVPISVAVEEQGYPVAISDGAGGAFISWTDTRNGANNYDVYLQRIRPSGLVTAVDDRANAPRLILGSTFPNPFSHETRIELELAEDSKVEVEIFDVAGRIVRAYKMGELGAGTHPLTFDGRDQTGQQVPSGVYFCRVNANGVSSTRKMVLTR